LEVTFEEQGDFSEMRDLREQIIFVHREMCRASRSSRRRHPDIDIPEGESSLRRGSRPLKIKGFPSGSPIVAFRSHARGRASQSESFICALSHFVFLFDKQPTLRRSFGSAKTGLVPDPISQQQLTADPRAT